MTAPAHVAALGSWSRVAGFQLAGAHAIAARDDADVLAAWEELPDDVELLVLTPAAARALGDRVGQRPRLLWVVLP